MNIRTLFVADMQKRQYITVDYCPTDEMILDLFTTPAGRAKLCHLRNIIMNISDYEYGPVDMDKLMTVHNKICSKGLAWCWKDHYQTVTIWMSTTLAKTNTQQK